MESSPQYANGFAGLPWRALACSLALHALALLALLPLWPQAQSGVPPAPRLLAHLQEPPASSAVLPAPTFSPPYPTARPRIQGPAEAPTFPPAAPVQAAAAEGGEPAQSSAAAPSVALVSANEEPGAPDAAGLRQYRLALASEARRYRRYPDAARRAGLAGTVEVRVSVAANGIAPLTELRRSSGHAQLDTAALEMLRLAAERTALPEALRHRPFAVLLPVVFEVPE